MSKYFIIWIFISLFSCKGANNTSLEIYVTSINNTSLTELKALYLTDLVNPKKSISFKNIHCVRPNYFLFKNIPAGEYYGVINIEKGARYYIDLGNIIIKQGSKKNTEEINLGTVKLPD